MRWTTLGIVAAGGRVRVVDGAVWISDGDHEKKKEEPSMPDQQQQEEEPGGPVQP